MKLQLGFREWRPYFYFDLGKGFEIQLELPRTHFFLEWDPLCEFFYGYIDHHGKEDYRMWQIGLSYPKLWLFRKYIHTKEAIHYSDWR